MSRKGLLFAFIILAFLGAAININAGWLYFFSSALIGFITVAFIYHLITVRSLGLKVLINNLHVDTGSNIIFGVYSEVRIAPYNLIFYTNNKKYILYPELNAGGFYEYRLNIPLRGKYDFKKISVGLFDTTGLIILKKKVDINEAVYVYPQSAEYNDPIQPVVYQGMIREGRAVAVNTGVMFSYIREYSQGDTIRTINWRDYAKTGTLTTKLMESEVGSQTLVVNITAMQENNISKGFSTLQGVVETGNIHRVMFLVGDSEALLDVSTPEWYEYMATVKPQVSAHALADVYIEDSSEVIRFN